MIITYLIKALTEKESVYVNKLGLFSKQYESAQIHDGQITPPGYKVVFDPNFEGNGFGFTMFVSQKGGLLITEATSQIDQWVSQLKTALDNNKSVCFENFGTFAKNDKGDITYICDRIAELNTDFEGMEPVSIDLRKSENNDEELVNDKEVVNENEKETAYEIKADIEEKQDDDLEKENKRTADLEEHEEIVEENKDNEKMEDEAETNSEKEGIVEEEKEKEKEKEEEEEDKTGNEKEEKEDKKENEEENEEEKPEKKSKWWIVLIIILILALLAAATYYFKDQLTALYNKYFGQSTEIVLEAPPTKQETTAVTNTDSSIVADRLTLDNDTIVKMDNSGENDSNVSIHQTVTENLGQHSDDVKFFINFEKGKHYVIVGSFRNEKDVRQHIKDRKLEQYKPKVVMQPNSQNMRICIGIFDTEAAADNYGRSTGMNYWVLN